MKIKLAFALGVILLLGGVVFGSGSTNTGFESVKSLLTSVCSGIKTLLPPISLLMFLGSGVVYAGGQFVGAETRARANVWATNMLIGAIIGLMIAAVVPTAIDVLYGGVSSGCNP